MFNIDKKIKNILGKNKKNTSSFGSTFKQPIFKDKISNNYKAIHLDNNYKKRNLVAYTYDNKPQTIFLSKMKDFNSNNVADVLEHETIHNILSNKQYPKDSTRQFDNIAAPAVKDKNNNVLNKNTFGKIFGNRQNTENAIYNDLQQQNNVPNNLADRMDRYYRRLKRDDISNNLDYNNKEEVEKYFKERKIKQLEENKMYDNVFLNKNEKEKAYNALKLSAERHRHSWDNNADKRQQVRYNLEKTFNEKPISTLHIITNIKDNKIQTQPIKQIKFNDEESKYAANELMSTIDSWAIREEAKEQLSRTLYNTPYVHELNKQQKEHLNYLINKYSKAR